MNAAKPDDGNGRTTTQRRDVSPCTTAFCSSAHSVRGRPELNRENGHRYVTMVSCRETLPTAQTGLPYFDRAADAANGDSKREKVVFWSQNVR